MGTPLRDEAVETPETGPLMASDDPARRRSGLRDRGLIHEAMHDFSAARRDYRQFLQEYPTGAFTESILERLDGLPVETDVAP